jgi:hypothetical protein
MHMRPEELHWFNQRELDQFLRLQEEGHVGAERCNSPTPHLNIADTPPKSHVVPVYRPILQAHPREV